VCIIYNMKNLPSIYGYRDIYCSRSLLLNIFCTLSPLNDRVPLLLLFLIRDPSGFRLTLLHLTKVHPNSSASKGVSLRRAAVLFVGRTEAADEGIEAAPCLSERAGTRCRRGRLTEEDATVQVDLGLPELIEVAKKIQDMVEVALRESNWGTLILQVLPEGVPVSPFLWLVTAERLVVGGRVLRRRGGGGTVVRLRRTVLNLGRHGWSVTMYATENDIYI